MTLADVSSGPAWVSWAVILVLIALAFIFFSGKGTFLISGYNTMSNDEKETYDEKKLGKVFGAGMIDFALLVLIMTVFESKLPSYFVYIALVLIVLEIVCIAILANTYCKK